MLPGAALHRTKNFPTSLIKDVLEIKVIFHKAGCSYKFVDKTILNFVYQALKYDEP